MKASFRTLAAGALLCLASAQASAITVLGSFAFSGTPGLEMDINPNGDLVYIAGGMGQSGLIRVNASNPLAMSQVGIGPGGGGVAVDPGTGRFATTVGGSFFIYNSNLSTHFSSGIPGCGGSVVSGGGLFGVNTQCFDHFSLFSQAPGLVFQQPLGGVGGQVGYNPATGNFYSRVNNSTRVITPSLTTSTIGGVFTIANGVTNRLYGGNSANQIDVIDGNTHGLIGSISLTAGGALPAVSSLLNQVYAIDSGQIKVFDGATHALLQTLALPNGYLPYSLEAAHLDDRLYVLASKPGNPNALFVLDASAAPVAGTLWLMLAGLLGLLGFAGRAPRFAS